MRAHAESIRYFYTPTYGARSLGLITRPDNSCYSEPLILE